MVSTLAVPSVTVVMPVLNAMHFLPTTIPALLAAVRGYSSARVIVVDNGSSDGSLEWLGVQNVQELTLMHSPGSSISSARNRGAAAAGAADVLAFVDADCLVHPDYFFAIATAVAAGATVTGSRYALPSPSVRLERAWQRLHERHGNARPAEYINGGNLVISKAAFDEVGGFAPDVITGEDVEICYRLRLAGHVIDERPDIRVEHLGNPKTLRAFYRKQVWHAIGMFDSAGARRIDNLSILALIDVVCSTAAVGLLVARPWGWGLAVGFGLVLACVAPAVAVVIRLLRGGHASDPLTGVLLYKVYLTARMRAMGRLLAQRLHRGDPLQRDLRG